MQDFNINKNPDGTWSITVSQQEMDKLTNKGYVPFVLPGQTSGSTIGSAQGCDLKVEGPCTLSSVPRTETMNSQCEMKAGPLKTYPDKDPWKHRSAGMRCRTCIWFVEKLSTGKIVEEGKVVGRCRRHAPTMNGYPVVFSGDWCGDHRLDENK